jgi:methyltransferase (TIGR00027 family)
MTTPAVNEESLTIDGMARTWASDKAQRGTPDKLTLQFHSAVPILKHLDWRVTDTRRGYAQTVLPLNVESSNQHITHQAAVILIAADYTGGIALGTLLNQTPLVGIHPQSSEYGAYLWGGKADIKWIKPSCDDLVCTAEISPDRHEMIARRFFRGARVLETVHIDMRSKGELIAEANLTYWVQDTYALRKNAFVEEHIHVLYDHRQKTSARLIAGLRSLEQDKPAAERLFEDTAAAVVAEKHGRILAERFCLVAPQLQPMVAARTRHLDDAIQAFHQGRAVQIVNIGAGLDSRLFRQTLPEGSAVFDLDLPAMLRRREAALAQVPQRPQTRRVPVPIDLREHDVSAVLSGTGAFDPAVPTFVVWEGGSMYFEADEVSRILSSVSKLLTNADSLFWMDYVLEPVVKGTSGLPVVEAFTEAMCCLGEPFINGFAEVGTQLAACGLAVEQDVPSRYCLKTDDPVFELYRFCLAKRMGE